MDLVVKSNITFLYYRNLTAAAIFYEKVMGFTLVEDQVWAKIFRISGNGFVGIVDGNGEKGFHQAQDKNAVMLTLVVDDVPAWYQHLQNHQVEMIREPAISDEIQVEYFFCKDPGGYVLEVEKFLKPELTAVFYNSQ